MNVEQFAEVLELLGKTEGDVIGVAMLYIATRCLVPILFSLVVLYLGAKTLNLIGTSVRDARKKLGLTDEDRYRMSDRIADRAVNQIKHHINCFCDSEDDRMYRADNQQCPWWKYSNGDWSAAEPPAGWVEEKPVAAENSP